MCIVSDCFNLIFEIQHVVLTQLLHPSRFQYFRPKFTKIPLDVFSNDVTYKYKFYLHYRKIQNLSITDVEVLPQDEIQTNDLLNHENGREIEKAIGDANELADRVKILEEEIVRAKQVSISPSFYARVFSTKVFHKAFLYLYLRFEHFLAQEYRSKCAHNMLGKLTIGSKCCKRGS